MTFNLFREPWLSARMRGGARRLIRPADIAATGENEPVAFDYPRPDLETAAHELLIGLLTAALPPGSEREWRDRYHEPPSQVDLQAAFAPLERAFDLDGEGPRFLQEFGGLEGDPNPIDSLLIDSPGENAAKKNSDLLTHRGRYGSVSRPAAAIILYAMQSLAPSGGAGIRTSLRGGGPLSLLTIPGGPADGELPSLWRQLWANVVPLSAIAESADEKPALGRVFPWLAPPPLDGKLQPNDPRAHPLQAFFGTPRRLWLVFGGAPARCPILGALGVEDERPVVGVVQKPRGIDYGVWTHPLTPYRRQNEAEPPYSAKPKSGRFGYRDWVAGVLGDKDSALQKPARAMVAARARTRTLEELGGNQRARLRAAGWAMNNMEAKEYLLAEESLHLAADARVAEEVAGLGRGWAEAGDLAHGLLRQGLKTALFAEGAKPSTDKGVFEVARVAFFDRTEPEFHRLIEEVSRSDAETLLSARAAFSERWRLALRRVALDVFDELAPIPIDDPLTAEPVAEAMRWMLVGMSGAGTTGKKLFEALGLPLPSGDRPKNKKGGAT